MTTIPEPTLATIRERLPALQGAVKIDYFHQTPSALVVPGREPCRNCAEVKSALEEIAALSDRITLTVHEYEDTRELARKRKIEHVPGIVLRGELNRPLRFYGMPAGVFLPVFVQGIIRVGDRRRTAPPAITQSLHKLRSPIRVRVFGAMSHEPSAGAAAAAWGLGLASAKVEASVYELTEFATLAAQLGVTQTPTTLVGERTAFAGVASSEALARLLYDLQAHPDRAQIPEIMPESAHAWSPPQAEPGQQPQRPQGGERRTPGGLILPGR